MEKLIDRIRKEHTEYLEYIKQLPPEEIIRQAYEICYREEFIIILETKVFDDEEIEKLLQLPDPVGFLYSEWLKTDASVGEMLEEVVTDFLYKGESE